MRNIDKHRSEYQYDYLTELHDIIPDKLAFDLRQRITATISEGKSRLVDHKGKGTEQELDGGGKYFHHILLGQDCKALLPELVGVYHALVPTIAQITCSDVVVSPYTDSDINIKAYPAGGGTIGGHLDTNGITALIYLTTNTEASLVTEIPRAHPSKGKWTETKEVYPQSGTLLLMKGREVWHWSAPTKNEVKYVAVLNYYVRGDCWRPAHFDTFVYEGLNDNKKREGTILEDTKTFSPNS